MKTHAALLLMTAALLPGAAAAQGFGGPGPGAFSLYRGSEVSLRYGQVRDGESIVADELEGEARATFWLAPFLGAQLDVGLRWIDLDNWGWELGVHLHALAENGSRFGVFYLPVFVDEDDFGDDRIDNYGVEAMVQALPELTVEARLGRFDGAVEGPYFGAAGYYALSPTIALTGDFQHTRSDSDVFDVNFTDVIAGVEYYIPSSNARVSGGVGLLFQSGDFDDTDLRLELGATLFTFGEPATTARTRTFGRQKLPGVF